MNGQTLFSGKKNYNSYPLRYFTLILFTNTAFIELNSRNSHGVLFLFLIQNLIHLARQIEVQLTNASQSMSILLQVILAKDRI